MSPVDTHDTKPSITSRFSTAILPQATLGALLVVELNAMKNGDISTAWILACATAAMGCIFAFMNVFEARGLMKKAGWRQSHVLSSLGFAAGIGAVWLIAKTLIPKEISSNNNVMAVIMFSLLASQFVSIVLIRQTKKRRDP